MFWWCIVRQAALQHLADQLRAASVALDAAVKAASVHPVPQPKPKHK